MYKIIQKILKIFAVTLVVLAMIGVIVDDGSQDTNASIDTNKTVDVKKEAKKEVNISTPQAIKAPLIEQKIEPIQISTIDKNDLEALSDECISNDNGFYCVVASVKYSLEDFLQHQYKIEELNIKGCELNNAISCRQASQSANEDMKLQYRAKACKLALSNIKPINYDETLQAESHQNGVVNDVFVVKNLTDEIANCARLKPSDFDSSRMITFSDGYLTMEETVSTLKENCIADTSLKDTYCSSLRYSFGEYLDKNDKIRKTKAFKETKPFY